MKLAIAMFLAAGLLVTAGCGYIGPVLPPSLDVPMRVVDLRVAEYGDKIRAMFTIPATTTQGTKLESLDRVELRIGPIPNPFNMTQWIGSATPEAVPSDEPGPVDFSISAQPWIGKEVAIAVRMMGPKGKWSDWSALKNLQVVQPLATPANLTTENTSDGVKLTWASPATHFRIFRLAVPPGTTLTPDQQPDPLAETDHPEYLDSTTTFGTKYTYYVQAFTGEYLQSPVAVAPPITPVDVFAPSEPTGLTAEQGVGSIDLSWERNTDPRFQGYNVYRSTDGGAQEKVASLIPAPTYSDHQIQSGKKYRYTVAAVGTNGKESTPSAPFEITAQ